MRFRRWVLMAALLLVIAGSLAAQSPAFLVENIETTEDSGSKPVWFSGLDNGTAVFSTRVGNVSRDYQFWATDGTEQGTVLLESIHLQPESAAIPIFRHLAAGDFAIAHGFRARGLWGTDGTQQGTHLLSNISVQTVYVNETSGTVFIVGSDEYRGNPGLYVSDGTVAGTRLLRSNLTPNSQVGGRYLFASIGPLTMLIVQDRLAIPSTRVLWKTDGTIAGTTPFLPIRSELRIATSDRLIFGYVTEPSHQFSRTDGTIAGTEPILRPGPEVLSFYGPAMIRDDQILYVAGDLAQGGNAGLFHLDPRSGPVTEIYRFDEHASNPIDSDPNYRAWNTGATAGDLFYFSPGDPDAGHELWRSDGTTAGTSMIADLCPGPCSSVLTFENSAELDGQLLTRMDDGTGDGCPPWITGGTESSTRKLNPGLLTWSCRRFGQAVRLGERVVLEGPTGLWSTDGTTDGTIELATGDHDLRLGAAKAGERLFYPGTDYVHGVEPWVTDGTPAGTSMIANLHQTEAGSNPRGFTANADGDGVLFSAFSRSRGGHGLWSADPAGTSRLLVEGIGGDTHWIARLGSRWVFAVNSDHHLDLWSASLDGANAERFATLVGHNPLEPRVVFTVNERAVFTVNDEIWTTDGTSVGTQTLEPVLGLTSGPEAWATPIHDKLVIRGQADRLWTTDGTAEGTEVLMRDAQGQALQGDLVRAFDDALYFGSHRTDGTAAGTIPVPELGTLPWPDSIRLLDATATHLFYRHSPCSSGCSNELWSLSSAGVLTLVDHLSNPNPGRRATQRSLFYEVYRNFSGLDLRATQGTVQSNVTLLSGFDLIWDRAVATDNRLFFRKYSDPSLWASDGTREGTDLLPSAATAMLDQAIALADEVLLFPGSAGDDNIELWRSDGTDRGTYPLADLEPGPSGSDPADFTVTGETLYFAATTEAIGREPWAIALDDVVPPTLSLTAEDRFDITVTWQKPSGERGSGRPVRLTDDTGYFWFFNETNVELVVKVLDARPSNGHFWVFFGSLSNVAYTLEVRDTVTGAVRTYDNPQQNFGSVGDTQAFPAEPDPVSVSSTTVSAPTLSRQARQPITEGTGTCVNANDALCLQQQRFRVEVTWQDSDGISRTGTALSLSPDTGYFWFGNSANVELIVKVLDGRNNNGSFWVFFGALSNLAYTLTVTDTETGAVQVYDNPRGTFASRGDTEAFPQ